VEVRCVVACLLTATIGCSARPPSSFVLEDPGSLARSAQLVMCESASPMPRRGDTYTSYRTPTCQGSAFIAVIRHTRRKERCEIDYVEEGAEQHWLHRLTPTSCELIQSRAGSTF
jgi:hypothetical protein